MNRKSLPQRELFPDESPNWETLSQEQQDEVQEVLSLLLEKSLPQHFEATHSLPENTHV